LSKSLPPLTLQSTAGTAVSVREKQKQQELDYPPLDPLG
jgi:hypothetical protein